MESEKEEKSSSEEDPYEDDVDSDSDRDNEGDSIWEAELGLSEEEGIETIAQIYEAGLVPDMHASKHSLQNANIPDGKLGVEKKDIIEVVEPREHDYTCLEREVWDEEPRRKQMYRDTARDKWFEEEGSIATALGFAMCGYSLWTFPQLCIKYGSFVFCVMYFIVTCWMTVPAIYFEMFLGQFLQTGPFHSWKVVPIFIGLGAPMLANTFMSVIMNNTRLVWLLFYACESLRYTFPWASCSREWTTSNCVDFDVSKEDLNLSALSKSPAYEYFRARVLRVWKSDFADEILSSHPYGPDRPVDKFRKIIPFPNTTKGENGKEQYDINNIGIVSLDLLTLLVLIYIMVHFILQYRIRFMGAMNFGILLLGYFMLTITFTYAWLLTRGKGALVDFFASTGYHILFLGEAWFAAIRHSIIATGLGTGMYFVIGSHRGFTNRRIKNIAIAAGVGSWATHCFIAVITTVFWEMAQAFKNTGENTTNNISYFGMDPVIEVFPLIIAQGPEPKLSRYYSFCFFGGLVCLSFVRTVGGIYLLKRTLMDQYKQLFESFRIFYDPNERGQYRRWDRLRLLIDDELTSAKLLVILLFATGLTTTVCLTRGGIYIQLFLENYCIGISFTFVFFVEAIGLTYIFGIRNLDNVVRTMTGYQSTLFYRIAWKYFLPGMIFLYIVHRGIFIDEVEFDGIKLPDSCHNVGIIFASIPFLIMGIMGVKGIIETPVLRWIDKLKLSLAPHYYWIMIAGGKSASNRTNWLHYINFPTGFGEGPGFPKASEEMHHTCKGCGQIARSCWRDNCSLGVYSNNLFCIQYRRVQPRPPTPGKLMELAPDPPPKPKQEVERRPNKKLKFIQIENRDDLLEREVDDLTERKGVITGTEGMKSLEGLMNDLNRQTKSESNLLNDKDDIPERAETIRMSMKAGEVKRSVEIDHELDDDKVDELKDAEIEETDDVAGETEEEKAERLKELRENVYKQQHSHEQHNI